MKNREKYGDEILTAIKSGASCDFMKETVIPLYSDGRESSENFCSTNSCEGCSKLFAFWMDGDYEAPHTNWANVPVDTLVRVRDLESQEWTLRYFKGIDEKDQASRFLAWVDGATSITAYGEYESWTYCELAEDEE